MNLIIYDLFSISYANLHAVCLFFPFGIRYVLGAVETFLKAVPAAGIFKGNDWQFVVVDN